MDKKTWLKYLLRQYLDNEASEEEYRQLFALVEAGDEALEETISEILINYPTDKHYVKHRWEPVIEGIVGKTGFSKKRKYLRLAAIAAIGAVVGLVVGFWFLSEGNTSRPARMANTITNDTEPGGNRATLVLTNGTSIVLDSIQNGTVALQGGAKIMKLSNGRLVYKQLAKTTDKVAFNTVKTPRGGQYKVILPDGSCVWLNSASSIRFPTAFLGNDRHAFITGEAYFEVAENVRKPFIVSVNDMQIRGAWNTFQCHGL